MSPYSLKNLRTRELKDPLPRSVTQVQKRSQMPSLPHEAHWLISISLHPTRVPARQATNHLSKHLSGAETPVVPHVPLEFLSGAPPSGEANVFNPRNRGSPARKASRRTEGVERNPEAEVMPLSPYFVMPWLGFLQQPNFNDQVGFRIKLNQVGFD